MSIKGIPTVLFDNCNDVQMDSVDIKGGETALGLINTNNLKFKNGTISAEGQAIHATNSHNLVFSKSVIGSYAFLSGMPDELSEEVSNLKAKSSSWEEFSDRLKASGAGRWIAEQKGLDWIKFSKDIWKFLSENPLL
jgi:hypothetical protein